MSQNKWVQVVANIIHLLLFSFALYFVGDFLYMLADASLFYFAGFVSLSYLSIRCYFYAFDA